MKTVLAIDQSTQGTKALLLDEEGRVIARAAMPHRQIVDGQGYISHDLDEIWQNVLLVARECVGENAASVKAVGISNQRETSCMWNDEGPLADAVVWQCARAKGISDALAPYADLVRERTGLPLSPYFPAAKYAWLLRNTEKSGKVRLGTVDSFLVWKLTGNFYTDYSNASRTQLFDLHTLQWDEELCRLFGVPVEALPEVKDSDGVFGYTDLGGLFPQKVPVCGVLGDSHAALFAEGCLAAGQLKVTYGTGSSVMMNVGEKFVESRCGLASSLAWKRKGKVSYVLEGNINYSCAVITWLKDDLGLLNDAKEAGVLAAEANERDETVLIPAFSGLSAPYWKPEARAAILNMTRTTGKREICRAAEGCVPHAAAGGCCGGKRACFLRARAFSPRGGRACGHCGGGVQRGRPPRRGAPLCAARKCARYSCPRSMEKMSETAISTKARVSGLFSRRKRKRFDIK